MAQSSARTRYVVSRRRWTAAHEAALTAMVPVFTPPHMRTRDTPRERAVPLYRGLGGAWVSVPRAYGLAAFGAPERDERSEADALPPCAWAGPALFPHQRAAVAAVEGRAEALVSMSCGSGKTVLALWLATQVWRCRTLVLVHTAAIASQWVACAARVAPGLECALVRGAGSLASLGSCHLAVGMVQTLARAELPEGALDGFAVVVDEAHHTPCATMRAVLERSCNRRRLGLSATPQRADGMPLEPWFGAPAFEYARPQRVRVEQPRAPFVEGLPLDDAVARTTAISEDPGRTAWLASLLRARRGRVLALGHRVEQLRDLAAALGGEARVVCGATRAADREAALREARVALCSFSLAKEGLDTAATTLVFLTPPGVQRGALAQCVGRVTRSADGEGTVVDPVDCEGPLERQAATRARRWRALGYTVV